MFVCKLQKYSPLVFSSQAPSKVSSEKRSDVAANYGDESETVEFKQSLVYHPKSSSVDVDAQIFNIMRSVAGFMNNIGGTLYIGVRNDGSVNGIERDMPELNGGTNDSFGNYTSDWDGWNRLFIDSVRKYLGVYAATLVNVEKDKHNHQTVAKVLVKKSEKPIYVNNKILFRRQCNTTAMLTGDELTWFIIERLRGDALESFINQKYGYDTEVADVFDEDNDNKAALVSNIVTGAIDDERNQKKWLYLRFFSDGKYIITHLNEKEKKYTKGELVCDCQLQQYHKNEKQVLLMIYNGKGKVNKIDFDKGVGDWFSKKSEALQSNAPWTNSGNMEVKCVDRNDMLVAFYTSDGKDYCYVRDVSDINPSQTHRDKALFTGGHTLPIKNSKLKENIIHLPGTYRNWIAPIVNRHIELKDPTKKGTIRRLMDILKELYQNSSIV